MTGEQALRTIWPRAIPLAEYDKAISIATLWGQKTEASKAHKPSTTTMARHTSAPSKIPSSKSTNGNGNGHHSTASDAKGPRAGTVAAGLLERLGSTQMTASELAEKSGVKVAQVRSEIFRLKRAGIIRAVGNAPGSTGARPALLYTVSKS